MSCATRPTVEVVKIAAGEEFRSSVNMYELSERERRTCERMASNGDILAAKKLVTYHMMITRDAKEVRHWLRVVERLQKARAKSLQKRRLTHDGAVARLPYSGLTQSI